MNQDVQKFTELLKSDEALQEKMKAAAENYEGEQTVDAIFNSLIVPAAEESGLHFTVDDFREYVNQEVEKVRELNQDEMDQIAGGGGLGLGATACFVIGIGYGGAATGEMKDGHYKSKTSALCWNIGVGTGAQACAGDGVGQGF